MEYSTKIGITIIQHNVHHGRCAQLATSQMIIESNCLVALIQEPYVFGDRPAYTPSGYTCFYVPGTGQIRASMVVHDSLLPRFIPQWSTRDCVCVQIITNNKKSIILVSIYESPNEDLKDNELNLRLTALLRRTQYVCVGGDLNAHNPLWGSRHVDDRGDKLEQLVLQHSLSVLNNPNGPATFASANGQSWVDLTLASCNLVESISGWTVVPQDESGDLSDHRPIIFHLSESAPNHVGRKGYAFKKMDTDRLLRAIRGQLRLCEWTNMRQRLQTLTSNAGVDDTRTGVECCEQGALLLERTLQKAIRESTPQLKNNVLPKRNLWWNAHLDELKRKMLAAKRVLRRNDSPGNIRNYKKKKRDYQDGILEAKKQSWILFCNESMNTDPWDFAHRILCKGKSRSNDLPFVKSADGVFSTTNEETARILMSNMCKIDDIASDTVYHENIRRQNESWCEADHRPSLVYIERGELESAINSLQPYKAAGPDLIANVVIKQAKNVLAPVLLDLFNACLHAAYVPKRWKIARVTFIPKSRQSDMSDAKSYRPISLISCVGKLLEKILARRLAWFLESERALHSNQYGFRDLMCTEFAVDGVVRQATKALKSQSEMLAIFLDISAAFDAAWHPSIIASLIDKKVPTYLVKWIKDYLTKRKITCQVGGEHFKRTLERSCPQGGCLSPILWNCLIDDVFEISLPNNISIQGYADDLCILVEGEDRLVISEAASEVVGQLMEWGNRKKLNFNERKTEMLLFSRKRVKCNMDPVIVEMNGYRLPLSQTVRYLGVVLDAKLTWNAHLAGVVKKTSSLLMSLTSAARRTWGLNFNSIRTIYEGAVRPICLYACFTWLSALEQKRYVNMLQGVERRALRLMLNAPWTASLEALRNLAGLIPIELFARQLAVCAEIRWRTILRQSDMERYEGYREMVKIHRKRRTYKSSVEIRSNAFEKLDVDPAYIRYKLPLASTKPPWKYSTPITTVRLEEKLIDSYLKRALENCDKKQCFCFTDGSVFDDGRAGAAYVIYGWDSRRRSFDYFPPGLIRLKTGMSIYQCELVAILRAVESIRNSPYVNAVICSDSQSAISALTDPTSRDPLVWSVQEAIHQSPGLHVKLIWIRGHVGIDGNELADRAAKFSAKSNLDVTYETNWISFDIVKNMVKKEIQSCWNKTWRESDKGRFTWNLFPKISLSPVHFYISCSRNKIFYITRLLTGHYCQAEYLFRVGRIDSPMCQNGCQEIETLDHFLFLCPSRQDLREKFRVISRTIKEYLDKDFYKLVAYAVECYPVFERRNGRQVRREVRQLGVGEELGRSG